VAGRSERRAAALKMRISFEASRDYWMNAAVLATVARMVSARQGVQSGLHYSSAAMDPIAFMAELRKAGVSQTESFELGEMISATSLAADSCDLVAPVDHLQSSWLMRKNASEIHLIGAQHYPRRSAHARERGHGSCSF